MNRFRLNHFFIADLNFEQVQLSAETDVPGFRFLRSFYRNLFPDDLFVVGKIRGRELVADQQLLQEAVAVDEPDAFDGEPLMQGLSHFRQGWQIRFPFLN